MRRALIITGGYINFDKVKNINFDFSLVLAADSGYSAAKKLNIVPDIVLGDFDSLKERIDCDAEIITVPAEKDDTDTMLACKIAIERGCNELMIFGGTGGRADHFIANVLFLESLADMGIKSTLSDGKNTIRVVKDEEIEIKNCGGYFSVFALDECTVSLSGCKYPLKGYRLTRTNPFAVSNEVTGKYAKISVNGKIMLCESIK